MKIIESALHSQSSAYSYAHLRHEKSMQMSVRALDVNTPQQRPASQASSFVELSGESLAVQDARDKQDDVDPRLRLIISLIETLTGEKIQLFDAQAFTNAQATADTPPPAQSSQAPQLEWSIHIESKTIREEAEQAVYQAEGAVTTADGRTINFNLGLTMQRYQRSESSTTFDASNAPKKKDPLVLNLSTDQVRLTGETVRFDLNMDGQKDRLATLAAGSGYLVLDRNQNGKIDDGSELFGPVSGDGFSDLRVLDSDGNGWIDENDPAFSKLAVWQPGEQSTSLAKAGVGAIALENRATPYTLKTNDLEAGSVRSTGVFLTEEGQARTIQQIDLVA